MNNNKNIFKSSILATALIAAAGFNANANGLFRYNNLGSGEEVRTSLTSKSSLKSFELKCGADSTSKKGKDGKCGEGKCGGNKKKAKKNKAKEGKCGEGKCGEGKCGGSKKSS